jgi:hypothetical protein
MAFWHVARSRLTVAVLERAAGEPLLVSCATVLSEAQTPSLAFAPGLLEATVAAGACDLRHVVALDAPHCCVGGTGSTGLARESLSLVSVEGDPELQVYADPTAVAALCRLFEAARLRLVSVDCAPCARLTLDRYLGPVGGGSAHDPLTAVSVSPESELTAAAIATELAVPVGLAVGYWGLVSDAER